LSPRWHPAHVHTPLLAPLSAGMRGRIFDKPKDVIPKKAEIGFGEGGLSFRRQELHGVSLLLAKASRSPITGEISIRDLTGFPDFAFVDLARRPEGVLSGKRVALESDPYLFKAVPLLYRTWIYHCLVNKGTVANTSKHDPHETIKFVLSRQCVDAPINVGRNSPLLYYVPVAIGTCLTANLTLVVLMLVLICIMLFIAKVSNSQEHYRLARTYTLPLRLIFLVIVVIDLKFDSFLIVVGFLLTLFAIGFDFATGDCTSAWYYGMNCSYQFLHALENRLFVCWREGAFTWEDMLGSRGCVQEEVSQLAAWGRQHHLIADIGDMLVELRPLNHADWNNLQQRCLVTGEPVNYLSLNTFDLNAPPRTGMSTEAEDMMLEDL